MMTMDMLRLVMMKTVMIMLRMMNIIMIIMPSVQSTTICRQVAAALQALNGQTIFPCKAAYNIGLQSLREGKPYRERLFFFLEMFYALRVPH